MKMAEGCSQHMLRSPQRAIINFPMDTFSYGDWQWCFLLLLLFAFLYYYYYYSCLLFKTFLDVCISIHLLCQ